MSKVYLLVYDGFVPPRQALIQWLDQQSNILSWHVSNINDLLVLLWEGSAAELTKLLTEQGGIQTFVVVETGPDKFNSESAGWLPPATWDFIAESPRRVRRPPPQPSDAARVRLRGLRLQVLFLPTTAARDDVTPPANTRPPARC